MSRLTNRSNLSLFAQVYLVTDHYDHAEAGLSVTTLLKPLKQVILGQRVPASERVEDVADRISSSNGTAIHDGFERAWKQDPEGLKAVMLRLGIPARAVNRVVVNPTPEQVASGNIIPVYTEVRSARMVHGVKVTGKFDFIGDGTVEDLKNTGVWKYMNASVESFIWQGSLYRWLNPEKVTKDFMIITFNFTDWAKKDRNMNPERYPPEKMMSVRYNLKSLEETEAFVEHRVSELIRLKDVDEDQLPPCTDAELWRKPDQFRFYAKAENADKAGAKSTKNFDTMAEAAGYQASKGGGGAIRVKRGGVEACKYCPGFLACKQKDALIAAGDLVLFAA